MGEAPRDHEALRQQLLAGMPDDPAAAHQWLFEKHTAIVEIASMAELALDGRDTYRDALAKAGFIPPGIDGTRLRDVLEAIQNMHEIAAGIVLKEMFEVAEKKTLELPLTPDTRETIEQTYDENIEYSRRHIDFWTQRARQFATRMRRRHRKPRPHTSMHTRPRPRGRRERHVAESTTSADGPLDDEPPEPPANPGGPAPPLIRNTEGWIPCPRCGQVLVEEMDGTICGACGITWKGGP